jgi:adenosylmethionine-8-amino-7-oxononanoate aminotransferase
MNSNLIKNDNLVWHPFTVYNQHRIDPIKIVRANNEFLYDENGNEYIDLVSSWWTNIHGHCHPKLIEAISNQASQLDHIMFNDFTHQSAVDLSYELLKKTIQKNGKVLFSDCGSASVEIAMKIAHQYHINNGKEKGKFVALQGGYHGDTFGAMALSKSLNFHHHFNNKLIEVDFLPVSYQYIGQNNLHEELNCLRNIEDYIDKNKNDISFLIIEPLIQGASGMRVISEDFCKKLLEICQNNNIITIFDEVMTGFGRAGKLFATDFFELKPDIICLSKGLSGGMLPLAATVVCSEISDCFSGDGKTLIHGHTFTANPILCKLAHASLMLFDEESTLRKVTNINNLYHKIFEDFVSKAGDLCINYRICGTIFAFDLKQEIKFGSEISSIIKKEMMSQKMIIRPIGSSFYFLPPYCISIDLLKNSIFKSLEIIKKIFN